MQDFIDYLDQENLIQNLIDDYKLTADNNNELNLLNSIIEKLYVVKGKLNLSEEDSIIGSKFDIFGDIYEKTLIHEEKKKLGEFYTPFSVVNYILDAIGYKNYIIDESKKIIDISCGSGSFLIESVRRLIIKLLTKYKRKRISELTVKEAKSIIDHVKNNIYGMDIKGVACILCQINIHFSLFQIYKHIKTSDLNFHLPQFYIKYSNALLMDKLETYDFVVGNPPYLFIRDIPDESKDIIEKGDFQTNDGQYDYFQIFIELGINILKNGGFLGYIVPDSLLALTNRSVIREFIYNKSRIKQIYHSGPKFDDPVVSNILIILQKENNEMYRKKNQIKIISSDLKEKLIQQESLEKWDYKFLIHLNYTDISIIEKLKENFQTINDLLQRKDFIILLFRGVELTKLGEIIFCDNCKKFFPLPKKKLVCRKCSTPFKKENKEKIIRDSIPDNSENHYKLFLSSINRYQKNKYKYIDISKTGINYKTLDNYHDRIIIRQISQNNLICATYDNNLSLTSQSFYNLKILESPIPELNHLYLLGIINSTLLSYYFIKSFGSYKKLFPRILIEKIKDLPIKIPYSIIELEKANEIIRYVKGSLKNIEKIESNQKIIDLLVFDLYNISNNEREYIWNFMSSLKN